MRNIANGRADAIIDLRGYGMKDWKKARWEALQIGVVPSKVVTMMMLSQ